MKRVPNYQNKIFDLIKCIYTHAYLDPSLVNDLTEKHDKKMSWIIIAHRYINQISPILKRSKLTRTLDYLNELKKIVNSLGKHWAGLHISYEFKNVTEYRKNTTKIVSRLNKKAASYLKTIPDFYEKNSILANVLFVQGEYDKANKKYQKAIINNWSEEMNYFGAIITYILLGNYSAAYKVLIQFSKVPFSIDFFYGNTNSLSRLSVDDCLKLIEKKLCEDPDDTELILLKLSLGKFSNSMSNRTYYREGVKLIKKVVKKEPNNAVAFYYKFYFSTTGIGANKKIFTKEGKESYENKVLKMLQETQKLLEQYTNLSEIDTASDNILIFYNFFTSKRLYVPIKIYLKEKPIKDVNGYFYNNWDSMRLASLNSLVNHLQGYEYGFHERLRQIHYDAGNFEAALDANNKIKDLIKKSKNIEIKNGWWANAYILAYQCLCLIGLNKKKEAATTITKVQKIIRNRNFFI